MKKTAEKRCSGCKETKPLEDFYRATRQKDGKDIYCKTCRKQHTKSQLPNRKLKYRYNEEFRKKRLEDEKVFRRARQIKKARLAVGL